MGRRLLGLVYIQFSTVRRLVLSGYRRSKVSFFRCQEFIGCFDRRQGETGVEDGERGERVKGPLCDR